MKHLRPGKRSISCGLMLLGVLFVISAMAHAQGIKERMLARLPQIEKMKSSGILGEDKNGYLDFVGKVRKNEEVVAAENADRRKVYQAIAAKEGTTPELVGRRRALQIAENAAPGTWLQAADGKWYRK